MCSTLCILMLVSMYCGQTVGWINKKIQYETWHAGRPQPWPHCVRWGPSSPPPKGGGAPQFSAHVYCGQMAGWIKISLGMEVGLGPGHIVLDGTQLPLPQKGAEHSPNFRPISVAARWLHSTHPSPQLKQQINLFSRLCTARGRKSP